jgi:hypothetical protein
VLIAERKVTYHEQQVQAFCQGKGKKTASRTVERLATEEIIYLNILTICNLRLILKQN